MRIQDGARCSSSLKLSPLSIPSHIAGSVIDRRNIHSSNTMRVWRTIGARTVRTLVHNSRASCECPIGFPYLSPAARTSSLMIKCKGSGVRPRKLVVLGDVALTRV